MIDRQYLHQALLLRQKLLSDIQQLVTDLVKRGALCLPILVEHFEDLEKWIILGFSIYKH